MRTFKNVSDLIWRISRLLIHLPIIDSYIDSFIDESAVESINLRFSDGQIQLSSNLTYVSSVLPILGSFQRLCSVID